MSCSPRDQALLPPSSAEQGFVTARLGRRNSANLTPASGRQDHTILPSAATSLVRTLFDRSQAFRLALQSHRAQNAAASTASRPYVRDDRETPLCVGRDTQSSRRDLGCAKTEIFLQRGLDYPNQIEKSQQIALHAQRPRREIRSIQLGGGNGIGLRLLQQLQCGFQAATQIGGGVRTASQPCGRKESDSVEPSGFGTRMRVASSISIVPCIVPCGYD